MDDQRANREGGEGMTTRRFSLKRLLVSMTLTAMGLAAWGYSYRSITHARCPLDALSIVVLYLGGGALAWAGLFCLIKRTATGALLGLVFSALIVALLLMQK
jgi:hypothetical protein